METILVVLFVIMTRHQSTVKQVTFAQIFGRILVVLGTRQNGHLEELGVGYVVVWRVKRVKLTFEVLGSRQYELVGKATNIGGERADDKVRVGQEEDVKEKTFEAFLRITHELVSGDRCK